MGFFATRRARARGGRAAAATVAIAFALSPAALPDAAPTGAAGPSASEPDPMAFERFLPDVDYIRTRMDLRTRLLLYTPRSSPIDGAAVLLISGNGGWRPLMQDTGSFLATQGRYVLGIDATVYFRKQLQPHEWEQEFRTLQKYLNKKAGRPAGAPIVLAGFTFGAEIIPYIINRAGASGIAGTILMAPDRDGLKIFKITVELKEANPPEERFDVAAEIERMPPIPTVLMEGTLDGLSQARELFPLVTGPRKYVPITGGDRQFRDAREIYFVRMMQALDWIDSGPVATPAPPTGSQDSPPGSSVLTQD